MTDRELLLTLYRTMVRCRLFEEASAKAYAQGKIGGFCHLYIGQEAVGVGAISTLGPEDKVLASYRDHAHFLARGGDAKAAMAELFGRASGCSSGLGGSMHFFDVEKGFLGGWGIVGGQIPLAAGAAFASKYRGDGGVALCFFGEGATNQGAFHEALSLSALWKLPAVFLCENNHYAMGTPQERGHAMREISGLASSYEIARDRVAEGSEDVLLVRSRVLAAVERARKGGGATLMEIVTYRYRGHSMTDPAKYRTKQEVEEWRSRRDPLAFAARRLGEMGVSPAEIQAIDSAAEKEIEQAVAFAEASPLPEPETTAGNVYAPGVTSA